ncbi:MAG: hypothetical protein ACFB4J_12385 [Elainellaceae cyanobacterium]
MFRSPQRYLKPNPFTTYRDPRTGEWIVVQTDIAQVNSEYESLTPGSQRIASHHPRNSASFLPQRQPLSAGNFRTTSHHR